VAAVPLFCEGDCNGNGVVTVDELVSIVNLALAQGVSVWCPAVDANDSGTVTIEELIGAVDRALTGCGEGTR
jgi:hypothetical protein